MNNYGKFILKISLILIMLTVSGCASMAVEAGNKVYNHLRGDLLAIVPDKLPDVYQGTVTSLEKLTGFVVTDKDINVLNGHITAFDAVDRKVHVDLFRTECDQTRVQIRIGMIGDKIESVMIYDHIKEHIPQRIGT